MLILMRCEYENEACLILDNHTEIRESGLIAV